MNPPESVLLVPLSLLKAGKSEEETKAAVALMTRYRLKRIDEVRRDPGKFLREYEGELRDTVRELGAQDRQIENMERQLAALSEQVASLREQNTSLRAWLDQEQVAALEHAMAEEMMEKVSPEVIDEKLGHKPHER